MNSLTVHTLYSVHICTYIDELCAILRGRCRMFRYVGEEDDTMTSFETLSKKSLWARGSSNAWYNAHKVLSSEREREERCSGLKYIFLLQMSWQKVFKKSLVAYIGTQLIINILNSFII